MLQEIRQKLIHFFRPPPSEASQLPPHAGVAGLLIETCWRDGKLTDEDRAKVEQFLVAELGLGAAEATALRERAEEIQWTSLTPIGFATSAAKQLDEAQREELVRTMIRFIHTDNVVEAMENRMIMTTANIFGIKSGRTKQLHAEALGI